MNKTDNNADLVILTSLVNSFLSVWSGCGNSRKRIRERISEN